MRPHRRWLMLASLVVCSGLASSAHAFDGKGKGFLLGLGVGPNVHRIRESYEGTSYIYAYDPMSGNTNVLTRRYSSSEDVGTSVTFELQLGYGFTEKFLVYIWDREELEYPSAYVGFIDRTGLMALGLDYRLGRDSGPWFLSAGAGESYLYYDHVGWGVFGGGGRDLGRMSQVRFQLSYGEPTSSQSTLHAILILGILWR